MVDPILDFFDIVPDFDLNIMTPNQTLFDISARCLEKLQPVLAETTPDLIFVQGDTTTAFASSLAGFYSHVPVVHIEAGLRSANKKSPFPEEMNRTLTGHLATYHFTPTSQAADNLAKEGIVRNVWTVGNSVIDALFLGLELIQKKGESEFSARFSQVDFAKKLILVTAHRRENFGEPIERICQAILTIVNANPDVEIVFPVHLNPNIQEPVYRLLGQISRIHLLPPLEYPELIWLLSKSALVLTDSGGIQEEAPSLGKPVLVLREVTERMEGIEAKCGVLVGTDTQKIIQNAQEILENRHPILKPQLPQNPYGDGKTAETIYRILAGL